MTLSDMACGCDKGRETEDLVSTENGATMPIVRPLTAGVLLIGLSVPAAAAFRDSATGFSIAPPAPFVTEPTTHRTFDVAVGLRSATNLPPSVGRSPDGSQPFICEAGFKAAAQNDNVSKADINAMMAKPEWRKVIRSTLELVFQIDGESAFALQGYRGLELRARPKAGPGAENVRALISFVETARGRTTLICLTDRASFNKAVPQFRAVRATMTAPE
jgi:hypothetical protein